MYKNVLLKFSYLTKITNSAIEVCLELDALENLSVSLSFGSGRHVFVFDKFHSKEIC